MEQWLMTEQGVKTSVHFMRS